MMYLSPKPKKKANGPKPKTPVIRPESLRQPTYVDPKTKKVKSFAKQKRV